MKKLIIRGDAEDGAVSQAENCLVEAEAMLLMADNHQGYGMPVGGVAVYKGKICPAGVGFDIACGNKAVKTNLKLKDVDGHLSDIADKVFECLSFGVGLNNKTKVEHALFDNPAWDSIDFLKGNQSLKDKARNQLGTIGSGNHYVDVFADEQDDIWVGVHFGSRGLGHTIAAHFMTLAGDDTSIMHETPHTIKTDSKDGKDYIACMNLAGEYAYAGRDWVCETVTALMGGIIVDEVHNHHNFAWLEEHNGEQVWVVRKGATPAFPGQRGFIGSSMGDYSVIIEGVDSPESKELYYSTVHGAGRVMSRMKAKGKTKRNKETGELVVKQKPMIDWDVETALVKANGTELRGAGADECPGVYKKLPEVLEAHKGTIKIMHTLRPLIVCMAGSEQYDPYKD